MTRRMAWTWFLAATAIAVVLGLLLANGLFEALWVWQAS